MLSLDRFHLKQTPVLNFNCRDSLGFPSYILHKKTFFLVSTPVLSSEKGFFVFGFHDEKRFASLFFSLPKWAWFAFFQMFASFFFSLPKWLALHLFKMFASFFWNFGWRALGPDWEFSGIPPAWVLLGGPYFFWDFGNTLNFGGPSFLGTTLE